MKITVNENMFINAFVECGRKDQFSWNARVALFQYFEELEEDTGDEYELDPIAICCEWSEYSNAQECIEEQGYELEEDEDSMEYLRDRTIVIEFDGGIIIQQF